MKIPEDFTIISEKSGDIRPENVLFYSNFANQHLDKNLCNSQEKTYHSDILMSGEWRTNILLQDSQNRKSDRTLALRHLTSFEEKSMEDHGNRLKTTLENYLKVTNKQLCPEIQVQDKKIARYLHWEQLEQALSLSQQISENQKNYLISFCKRNTQGQLILKQMFNLIPASYLPQSLMISYHIIQDYIDFNVNLMDEDQIEVHVSINYSKIAENIKNELQDSQILPVNFQAEHEYQQMIGQWMETIFLGLNGVFESLKCRKSSLTQLQGFQTFQTSRKLIKID